MHLFFCFFLKYNDDFENLIINIEYRYLALINIISIFLGLPLSIVFDLILIKFFGLKYVIFRTNFNYFRDCPNPIT